MPPGLSKETRRRLDSLFVEGDRSEAAELLADECGNNLPSYGHGDESGMERIRFAALKVSGGSLRRLRLAVDLAKQDWRDLLVSSGFADDVHAHQRWFPG